MLTYLLYSSSQSDKQLHLYHKLPLVLGQRSVGISAHTTPSKKPTPFSGKYISRY